MSRPQQSMVDRFGVNKFQEAIRIWKELNKAGINPEIAMDDKEMYDHAYDHMYWRVARMVDAMMDVFPDMERRLLAFADYYNLPGTWQELLVKFIFKMDDNLVWLLIRANDGLTQIKYRAEAWMEEYATRRDGWMFQ